MSIQKNTEKSQRIGLLGGSFNPVHKGHIFLAEEALKTLRLDEVWMVVSPQNPLKVAKAASFEERIGAVNNAVSNPKIKASDIELRLMKSAKRFYTASFLKRLQGKFRNTEFIFIMGADNLFSFHKWYKWKEICKEFKIVVFSRDGSGGFNLNMRRSKAYTNFPESFIIIDRKQVNISSTEIRDKKS